MSKTNQQKLVGLIEAILFVSPEIISAQHITQAVNLSTASSGDEPVDVAVVEELLVGMAESYIKAQSGFILRQTKSGWQLVTNPEYYDAIDSFVASWDKSKLNPSALEVLAILAYAGPVSKSQVASIRGVNSDSIVRSLVQKELVKEAQKTDEYGASLYTVSPAFYDRFNLKGAADLPDLAEFVPDDETRQYIQAQLSNSLGA